MSDLDLIDILTILSFLLQVQNNEHIIDLSDIQNEINRAVVDIHRHLAIQDDKIDKILEVLANDKN